MQNKLIQNKGGSQKFLEFWEIVAAATAGIEAAVMFTDEWATHRPGINEGSSRYIPNLLDMTLNSSEVSS